jgi:hypothetical protein
VVFRIFVHKLLALAQPRAPGPVDTPDLAVTPVSARRVPATSLVDATPPAPRPISTATTATATPSAAAAGSRTPPFLRGAGAAEATAAAVADDAPAPAAGATPPHTRAHTQICLGTM